MVNTPLIRPYLLGGVALGGYLRFPWLYIHLYPTYPSQHLLVDCCRPSFLTTTEKAAFAAKLIKGSERSSPSWITAYIVFIQFSGYFWNSYDPVSRFGHGRVKDSKNRHQEFVRMPIFMPVSIFKILSEAFMRPPFIYISCPRLFQLCWDGFRLPKNKGTSQWLAAPP